jgi:VWFA-related protein
MWVRAQTIRYLRALAPRTRVALFHLGKSLETFHDFTADADALRARLERTGVELQAQMRVDIDAVIRDAEQMLNMFPDIPDLDKTLRIQIENEMLYNADLRRRRVDTTLGALDALGRHLSGIPGRKSLVWIGGGISMLSVTGSMGMGPRGRIDSYESAVRAAAQRLAQQGVALYVVDARGLPTPTDASAGITATPPTRNRGRFEPQQQTEQISADPLPAAFTMAEITGGRVIRNSNDPGEGMRLAAADAGGAYSLAFYASTPPDGRWHTVKVKVRRSGVRLVTRQGFLAETAPASAAGWTEDEWQSALQDPLGSSAILLDARCEPVPGEPPGTIALILQFDLSALDAAGSSQGKTAEVEVGVAEKGPAGALGFHHEPRTVPLSPSGPASSMFAVKWKPASGAATIRAIVRDRRTGRYGSLDIPLPAPARPSAIQEITP